MHSEYSFTKETLIHNFQLIIDKDIPLTSNLANLSRVLFESFPNTSWAGFYLTDCVSNKLYLGPFQGTVACTEIAFGKGVCGMAALKQTSQLVPNVHEYPGHIACSSLTNSEIVVPIMKNDFCVGVIDLDSTKFNNYSEADVAILDQCSSLISCLF